MERQRTLSPLRFFPRAQPQIIKLAASVGITKADCDPEAVTLVTDEPTDSARTRIAQGDAAKLLYALRVLETWYPKSALVEEGHADRQACKGLMIPPRAGAHALDFVNSAWQARAGRQQRYQAATRLHPKCVYVYEAMRL